MSMPRLIAIGLNPAVTDLRPSRKIAWAINGSGGGAVAGDIGSLGGDFLHHLGADILKMIFELDFLGDRDAVFGDGRGAEFLVDRDIATARAEGDFDRIGQLVDANFEFGAGRRFKFYDFGHGQFSSIVLYWTLCGITLSE